MHYQLKIALTVNMHQTAGSPQLVGHGSRRGCRWVSLQMQYQRPLRPLHNMFIIRIICNHESNSVHAQQATNWVDCQYASESGIPALVDHENRRGCRRVTL